MTLTTTVDATNLVSLRAQFKAAAAPIARCAELHRLPGQADGDCPAGSPDCLNARWTTGIARSSSDEAHIGIAVDTETGLLVPVIRGAAALGVGEIVGDVAGPDRAVRASGASGPRRCRAARSRSPTWASSESRRSPRSSTRPSVPSWAWAGSSAGRSWTGTEVVGRERVSLSLTFDHRIVDGAPAARFLQQLAGAIENPGPWLMP